MSARPEEWPPCVDCDEPGARGTSPGGRCRECGVFIMREEIAGARASQHKPGCSLADSDDYGPMPSRDDEAVEARAVERTGRVLVAWLIGRWRR